METTKQLEILEHGLMMSDYFHGTSGVWLNIYPTPETTKKEAIEMIESEIDLLYDHIEYTAKYHNWVNDIWCGKDALFSQIVNEIKEMKEYIQGKEDELLCPDMDYDEDEFAINPVYIFTIEFTEE